MLLGYMNTRTLIPYKTNKKFQPNCLIEEVIIIIIIIKTLNTNNQNTYHGLRRQIGLELSTHNPTVPMGPGQLSQNATVMAAILLHLRLLNVGHALARVPSNLLLGVHSPRSGSGMCSDTGSTSIYDTKKSPKKHDLFTWKEI